MSRKRKAEQSLTAGKPKRNGSQLEAVVPKSARSAFLARQQLIESDDGASDEKASTEALGSKTLMPNAEPDIPMQIANPSQISHRVSPLDYDTEDSDSSDEDEARERDFGEYSSDGRERAAPTLGESHYPQSWKRARELIAGEILSQRLAGARIVITGTAGAGRSTFARYLTNTLLAPPLEELDLAPFRSIALLDLDPTKAVFGLPGHVTLLTVETTLEHSESMLKSDLKVHRSIPVGLYGQREDSNHFLTSTNELLHGFQELHTSMPVIVCCPSIERESDRGMDRRTLQSLISAIQADHICSISHKAAHVAESLDAVLKAKGPEAAIWEVETLLDSRVPATTTAVQKRNRALRDYFRGSANDLGSATVDGLSLRQRKPYAISYLCVDGRQGQEMAGCFIFGDLPPNYPFMISRILNGSVVSLAIRGADTKPNVIVKGGADDIPYFLGSDGGNPDPSMLRQTSTIGLGLIRSIDHQRGVLYVLTSSHVTRQLEDIAVEQIILVHGVADSPGWAYREDVDAGIEPCYLGKSRKGMQTVKSRKFRKKI